MSEDAKIRNYNVDDILNRDWMKLLLRLQDKKQEEQAVEELPVEDVVEEQVETKFTPTLLQRIKAGLQNLSESIEQWGKGAEEVVSEPDVKAIEDSEEEQAVPAYTEPALQVAVEDEKEGEVMPDIDTVNFKSVVFAFKALDGSDWWMQWTTNAFTDREGENFQTKALNDFVERHRGEKIKGEFWYRHIPGTKFGDITWQAMVGRFLVQAGPFDATPVGQAFKSFFQASPEGHTEIAPEGWGTSHGYQYNATDRKDNVYEWLEIKESTVLPLHAASNPWSPHPRIIQRSQDMNEQERKDLEQIGGKQLVDLVTREGEQRTKDLEGMGIGYKSLSGAMAKVMALMEAVEDADIKAALSEIYSELESPDEEGMPAEAMDIEENLAEMPIAEIPMAEATMGNVGMKEDVATRTEVAEALATLTTELRTEIKGAITASTQQITDALTPLLAEVKELRKRDGEKIAEKVAVTPAASLREMVQSVLDQKTAQVKDLSLFDKPAETPVPPRQEQGMPTFLASMFKS